MKFDYIKAMTFNCSNLLEHAKQLYNTTFTDDNFGYGNNHKSKIESLKHINQLFNTLAYLSYFVNNGKILELGSLFGISGLALSHNPTNIVDSYDIIHYGQKLIQKDNLNFYIEDIITKEKTSILLNYDMIFIDIAPHDGILEDMILNYLMDNNYKGITIWDDIHFGSIKKCNELDNWWKEIKIPKIDISLCRRYNSNTGLGIIDFSNEIKMI